MATPPKLARSFLGRPSASRRHKKISIEGNIAAGKSTFVHLLQGEVIAEPVGKWGNVHDVYQNQVVLQKPLHIFTYVFGSALPQGGSLSEAERSVSRDWRRWPAETFQADVALDAFVYLRAEAQRLMQRGCHEESDIPLEYLEQLHPKHENRLVRRKLRLDFDYPNELPILVLTISRTISSNGAIVDRASSDSLTILNLVLFWHFCVLRCESFCPRCRPRPQTQYHWDRSICWKKPIRFFKTTGLFIRP
ncbi:LOW QUALITY PROTEIN: deoxycytidine kinase-like [Phycodurus eques]|uniref:LOW QUALITY PROTEIN: deoxycytidine kinase-like n=1 Tax=Phycodurus eques TaxID=693459 RepID=UPI002ACD6E72|nr:LOW QUALITY PROTEIN: deoxycytidine kinase-like [Phycodurus eques]